MYPVLFKINIPEWLEGLLPDYITIYSYGFFIAMGALGGAIYTAIQAKKQFSIPFEVTNILLLYLILAAVIGGKVFYFFENPSYYTSNPRALISGKGFVFYGSLSFAIPTMLLFFKKHKIPIFKMLDVMAITVCIVHAFGRMGCLMAGCCHGIPWEGPMAIMFTDPLCQAKPLDTYLHPTQLYSITTIISILIVLLVIKKKKQFDGQLFLTYLILYAFGRSVIEIFRGDLSRGFIIENYLSHSQSIAILFLIVASFFYYKRWQAGRAKHSSKIN